MKYIKIVVFIVCTRFCLISGSNGDRSMIYQSCLKNCVLQNCTKDGEFNEKAALQQDFWPWLLIWSCEDECGYSCMWNTVSAFRQRWKETPKFYGKWPFTRILGVQEPASTFSSVLNLAANVYMYNKIRKEFTLRQYPLVLGWHIFAIVCMNAWVWSAIFHTRDKPFTEFMDYACALSMVMALLVSASVRVFHKRRKMSAMFLLIPLFYFVTHVTYLYGGRIDYDYNMEVNIFFGTFGSVLWLAWSLAQMAGGRRYAWRMAAFTLASAAALTLELLDFPPLWHAWDAHALWHLTTAPLPFLFYGFVIEDLRYLQTSQYEKIA